MADQGLEQTVKIQQGRSNSWEPAQRKKADTKLGKEVGTWAMRLSPERRGKNPTLGPRAKSLASSNQAVGCVWGCGGESTGTDRLENKGKRSCSRNLVSDWQSWPGARGPRSAEWLGQPAGDTKSMRSDFPTYLNSHMAKPWHDPETGQESSPKSSRWSSQLSGWTELKRFLQVTWVLGPKHHVTKMALESLKKCCWPRGLVFREPQQAVWPNVVLDDCICPKTRDSVLPTVWFTSGAPKVRKFLLWQS